MTEELFSLLVPAEVSKKKVSEAQWQIEHASRGDLEERRIEWMKHITVDVPKIDRAGAEFRVSDRGATVSVQLNVPYEGSAQVFSFEPPEMPRPDAVGRALGGTLYLVHDFSPGVDSAKVRSHFNRLLDDIEAVLKALEILFRQHNATVQDQIARMIARRDANIAAAEQLADDLRAGLY